MRSPLSFFDVTPLGRILNRFSKDTDTVDTVIPAVLGGWLMMTCAVFATIIVLSIIIPMLIIIYIPVGVIFFIVQVEYIATKLVGFWSFLSHFSACFFFVLEID